MLTWKSERDGMGFVVSADAAQTLIRLSFWGLWDDALGTEFERAMANAFNQIPTGDKWFVLADISRYPPQRPAVQECHGRCMRRAKDKVRKSANLVDSRLGELQIRRLSEESGLPSFSFFTTEASAMRWLRDG
jgi:hypothetical protein